MSTRLVEIPPWARSPLRQPLDEVRSDAERRERGIAPTTWRDAPSPPSSRSACIDGPRPCPALRCWFHCGQRGDGRLSCVLDVERVLTIQECSDVLGLPTRTIELTQAEAVSHAEASTPDDVLKALGIRRRPKGQTSGT